MFYHKGYTLIEILIVIFIMSIVSSVAVLSISRHENKQLESFANELTETLIFAKEQAMLQSSMLGVSLSEHSFQFTTYQSAVDTREAAWIPIQDTILGKHLVPNEMQIDIEIEGHRLANEAVPSIPPIIISTSGDLTPFVIYVSHQGEKPRYAVIGKADGSISNTLLS